MLLCSTNLKLLIWQKDKKDYLPILTCIHKNISAVVRRVSSNEHENESQEMKNYEKRTRETFEYFMQALGLKEPTKTLTTNRSLYKVNCLYDL
jgi:hypothetical protein